MSLEGQPFLYDYVKVKFKIEASMKPSNCPQVTWKDYKRQWLVLCVHIAPHHCFLTYSSQEDTWLVSKQTLPKIKLVNFELSSKANVVELMFPYLSLKLEFDSISKLQQWTGAIDTIKRRLYVELVRCPDFPQREKEYVIQLTPDRIIFFNADSKDWKGQVEFQWTVSVIKRAKYHNYVGKVEVEVGRAAEGGGGLHYFIGFTIKQFFIDIKARLEMAHSSKPVTAQCTISNNREGSSTAKSATLPHVPISNLTPATSNGSLRAEHEDTESPPPIPPRPNDLHTESFVDENNYTFGETGSQFVTYDSVTDNISSSLLSVSSETLIRRTSEPTPPPLPRRTLSRSLSTIRTETMPTLSQRPLNSAQASQPHYQPLQLSHKEHYKNKEPIPASTIVQSSYSLATCSPLGDQPKRPPRQPRPPPFPPPS